MINTAVQTAKFDRTIFAAVAAAIAERAVKGRPGIEDPVGGKLSGRKVILGAQVLSQKLEGLAPVGGAIGVMLPNSCGVAVVFLALQSIGRVPAMINFTAGAANIRAACRAAAVTTIATSRAFVDKGRLGPLVAELSKDIAIVYLEDVRATCIMHTFLPRVAEIGHSLRKVVDPALVRFAIR